MTFAVGRLAVVPEEWPSSWTAYAERTLVAERPREASIVVRCVHLSKGEVAPRGRPLLVRGTPAAFDVLDERGALARFAEDRLDIDARTQDPHLVLGNALRALASMLLPARFDGLLLHAASAAVENAGLVFAATSGTGKTTWSTALRRATYVSDDVSLVVDVARSPTLLGSPFFGAAGRRGADVEVPLACVGLLGQAASTTVVTRVDERVAVVELLRHVVSFADTSSTASQALAGVAALVRSTSVLRVDRSLQDESDDVADACVRAAMVDLVSHRG